MKYDVFISYSRKDYVDDDQNIIPGNIVSKIKDLLTQHGFTFWFDENGIYSGDAFVGIIADAIQNSDIFLFISTKSSNESKWTNHEIATAKLLGKKIIPFRVDNSIYDKSILMYLAPLDYIDYFKNPDKAFDALLASINHHYSKIKEAESLKLIQKEKEERLKQDQKRKEQRLLEIDTELNKFQSLIVNCDIDKSKITNRIGNLKEQINNCELELEEIAHKHKLWVTR